jgi:hypothetical protein
MEERVQRDVHELGVAGRVHPEDPEQTLAEQRRCE